jgi:Holliday junction resolvase YEN1
MYRISDIVAEWTRDESALKSEDDCRRAMVLVALLGGGDYVPEGVGRMGELSGALVS